MDTPNPLDNRQEGRSFFGPGSPDDPVNAARILYHDEMHELSAKRDDAFLYERRDILAETEVSINGAVERYAAAIRAAGGIALGD